MIPLNVLKQLPLIIGDTETSGLSPFFSQLLNAFFLCVTNNTFLDIRAAMELHRLPGAEALVINGTPLPELVHANPLYTSTHELVNYIAEKTPAIWIFHNAPFDAAMISNTIYQQCASSELYPFKKGGNVLFDSLQFFRAIHAFDNTCGIITPFDVKGNPTFKLEKLCKENSVEIEAHTAEGDTRALRELFELAKNASPWLYDIALQCTSRQFSQQKVTEQAYVYAAVGSGRNFSVRPVAPIAISKGGSDAVVVDLSSDLEKLQNYSPLEMNGFFGNNIHLNYQVFRLPLNKGNVILSQQELPFIQQMWGGWDEKELFRKASMIRRDKDIHKTALEALSWRTNSFGSDNPNPEERIYSHFPSPGEKTFINAFNLAQPEDKWDVIDHYSRTLKDDRFIRLARRVVLQNWREYAPPETAENYIQWCIERLFSEPMEQETVPRWETIYSCKTNVSRLRRKYPDQSDRIDELEEFYDSIAARVGIDLSNSFDN